MKPLKSLKWGAVLVLLVTLTVGTAFADRGGHYRRGGSTHFGVVIGAPWSPWYYPPPYYYPPPVIIERAPPVYIEQAPAAPPAPEPNNYWYYCDASRTYYPYVNECPGGWQRVLPRPPPPR